MQLHVCMYDTVDIKSLHAPVKTDVFYGEIKIKS